MSLLPGLDTEVQALARRHRRWMRLKVGAIAGCVLLLIAALWLGGVGAIHDDHARFDGKWFPVDRVIDGDTLRILVDGESVPVRLLGIDAPATSGAIAAMPAVGQAVLLQIDGPQTRDDDGNLLAYVYLANDDMLNRRLVAEGNAFAYRPHRHPFAKDFEAAEGRARKKGLGFWATMADADQPAWRQAWLREQQKLREEARLPWQE